jgi:hypothetical protein
LGGDADRTTSRSPNAKDGSIAGIVHALASGIERGDHFGEHVVEVSAANPDTCTPGHDCDGHERGHKHGAGCGHEAVPHGDHVDYLVDGHLHHPHGSHCDHHGALEVVAR